MAPSLEESAKQFAQQARNKLEAEVAKKKNAEVKDVTWQGYDADGNPLVKDKDQTKTARGLGNASQTKGSKLIYDSQNTVEYKRKAPKKPSTVLPKKERKALQPPARSRSLLPPLELFLSLINPQYICTYSTFRPDYTNVEPADVETDLTAGLSDYSVSQTVVVPAYTNQATGGTTWRITTGAVAAASRSIGGQSGTASASLSGLGLSLSITCSGDSRQREIGIDISQTTNGGSFEYELDGSNLPLAINLLGGNAQADAECMHVTFPRAVWYYQIPNDPEDETQKRIYQIDLNNIAPNQVFESKLVHNFAVREGDDVFVYSVWFVIDVDMTQTLTTLDTNTTYTREIIQKIGRRRYYIVHARLNTQTGQIETKINESPNTGNYRGAPFEDIIEYTDDDKWLIEARALADAVGGVGGDGTGAYIDVLANVSTTSASIEDDFARGIFNPEAVWRESYAGDWINAYNDVSWSNAAFVNITDSELFDFLFSSYKNNKFYRGWDSVMPTDLVAPEFIEWDPTGDPYEGNARPNGDWTDIENLQATIELSGTQIQYANYFDGSQEGVPDDFSDWRTWAGSKMFGLGVDHLGPNFETLDTVIETGVPLGNRLRTPVYFSFIPPYTPEAE